MGCKGLHCDGCGKGGLGVIALVVIVALVVIGAIGNAVRSAVSTAAHVLAVVLEVAFITVISLAAVAAAVALGSAGLKAYRWHSARQVRAAPVTVRAEVIPPATMAIEPPRARLDPLAATGIRQEVTDDAR